MYQNVNNPILYENRSHDTQLGGSDGAVCLGSAGVSSEAAGIKCCVLGDGVGVGITICTSPSKYDVSLFSW